MGADIGGKVTSKRRGKGKKTTALVNPRGQVRAIHLAQMKKEIAAVVEKYKALKKKHDASK